MTDIVNKVEGEVKAVETAAITEARKVGLEAENKAKADVKKLEEDFKASTEGLFARIWRKIRSLF